MKRCIMYIVISIIIGTTENYCYSQKPIKDVHFMKKGTTEWSIAGHFAIDSVYQIEMATIYTVSCVDTIDLHWPGFFKNYHNYRGISFTIVSFPEKDCKCGRKIKVGHVYYLNLTPIGGIWKIYDALGENDMFEDVVHSSGMHIRIPWAKIYNQIMSSPNIVGEHYYLTPK